MINKSTSIRNIIYCHDEVKHMLDVFCELTLPSKLFKLINKDIIIKEVKDEEEIFINDMKIEFFDIKSQKKKSLGLN